MNVEQLLLLATEEGVPGTHIASTIVPIIGAIVFCGSVYVLVWSIYGAKKGALVYGTMFFAFGMMIGVFWWFGAPGTPVATGLTYFPGQPNDQYTGKWFAMEPGSERAEGFEVADGDLDGFETPTEFVDGEDADPAELADNPRFQELSGDLATAGDTILSLYLPSNETGTPLIGADRRQRMQEEADAQAPEGKVPDSPFFTARVAPAEEGGTDTAVFVTQDRGLRVAAARVQVVATYVSADPEAPPDPEQVVVEEQIWYAFKDPGAIWFPSAVWTVVFGALFLACLVGLDRVEQREKQRVREREPVAA